MFNVLSSFCLIMNDLHPEVADHLSLLLYGSFILLLSCSEIQNPRPDFYGGAMTSTLPVLYFFNLSLTICIVFW